MAKRILASVLLLFSVLFLPFWVTAILALAGMVYFPRYFEAVALLFLVDALYGAHAAKFGGFVFAAFTAGLVAIVIVEILKTRLKFYS